MIKFKVLASIWDKGPGFGGFIEENVSQSLPDMRQVLPILMSIFDQGTQVRRPLGSPTESQCTGQRHPLDIRRVGVSYLFLEFWVYGVIQTSWDLILRSV